MSATLLALLAVAMQQVASSAPELQVAARSASGAEQPEFAHAISRALVVTGASVVLGTPGAEPCARCVAVAIIEEARGRYRIEARQRQRFASGFVEVKADSTAFERARAIAVEVRLLVRWAAGEGAVVPEAPAAVPEPQPVRAEPARTEPVPVSARVAPARVEAGRAEPRVEPAEPALRSAFVSSAGQVASASAPPEPTPATVAESPAPTPAPPPASAPAQEPVQVEPEPAPAPESVAAAPADPAWMPKPSPPPAPAPSAEVPVPEAGSPGKTIVEVDVPRNPAPSAPALQVASPAPRTLSKVWPWIPTAVGAASALAAGGCAIGAKIQYDSLVNRTVSPDRAPGARTDGKNLQTASLVLTGVAAAALAAGVVGFIQGAPADVSPRVSVGVGPMASGGVAMGISGSLP
ncbi:MAG TPA: hypothetical protein VGK67_06835 [Myxococcales bacterium]